MARKCAHILVAVMAVMAARAVAATGKGIVRRAGMMRAFNIPAQGMIGHRGMLRDVKESFQITPQTCGTLNDGRWQPSDGSYERTLMHRLETSRGYDGDESNLHFFEWKPSRGDMPAFSADQFCELLPGNVLLVGDSLTKQHFEALKAELGGELHANQSWYPRDAESDMDLVREGVSSTLVCNGTRMVAYIRNDWLDTRIFGHEYGMAREPKGQSPLRRCPTTGESDQRIKNAFHYCMPWAHPDIIKQFGVFVLNSGAHFVTDELYAPRIHLAATHLKLQVRDAMVFYRTTVPGFDHCKEHVNEPPFNSLDAAERFIDDHDAFNWSSFQRQNVIAKKEFKTAGFLTLDVYPSTVLRRDVHRLNGDCLHFRMPGPFPHWNRLLMSEMLCTEHTAPR